MSDIVKIESFNGVPVRVVTINDQPMIPLNDVADSITHDRSGLRKLFHRNEEIVGKLAGIARLKTNQGIQDQICLTYDGVATLLMKVDFVRMRDPVRKQRVIDFQNLIKPRITGTASKQPKREQKYPKLLLER